MKIIKMNAFLMLSLLFLASNAALSEGLSHESELGVVASGGNTDSQTINAKQLTAYKWTSNELSSKGNYLYGEANEVKSANSWSLGLRYDRNFSERFGAFLGNLWEGDEFAGVDYKSNVDLGLKYFILKTDDKNYLVSELGYRYTYENRDEASLVDSVTDHYARAYLEAGYQLSESVSAKLWLEYLPNLSDSDDYLINFEPSLSVALSSIFSMKVAYLGKYDAQPSAAGNKDYDWLYTTSLLAKF